MVETTATWALPRDLTAGAAARRHVAEFLSPADEPAPAGQEDLLDACELVASELAVNAVRHGRPPATLFLHRDGHRVRVEVTCSAGTKRPMVGTPADVDPQASNGRGLAIVASLADDLDWTECDGRITVWAVVSGPPSSTP